MPLYQPKCTPIPLAHHVYTRIRSAALAINSLNHCRSRPTLEASRKHVRRPPPSSRGSCAVLGGLHARTTVSPRAARATEVPVIPRHIYTCTRPVTQTHFSMMPRAHIRTVSTPLCTHARPAVCRLAARAPVPVPMFLLVRLFGRTHPRFFDRNTCQLSLRRCAVPAFLLIPLRFAAATLRRSRSGMIGNSVSFFNWANWRAPCASH